MAYIMTCECDECLDSNAPCRMDCEEGEECQGCWEAKELADDLEFEAKLSQGRL